MKKQLFVIVLCLLASFEAISQFQKNDNLVALSVAPYPTTTSDENDFGLILKVDAEFFIANKLSFVTTAFYSSNTAFTNASGVALQAYGIIPSLQYYLINKERWSIHLLGGYGFGFTDRDFRGSQNSAISIFSLGVGASYKLKERLYLKLQLPYFKAQNMSFDITEVEGAVPFIGVTYGF